MRLPLGDRGTRRRSAARLCARAGLCTGEERRRASARFDARQSVSNWATAIVSEAGGQYTWNLFVSHHGIYTANTREAGMRRVRRTPWGTICSLVWHGPAHGKAISSYVVGALVALTLTLTASQARAWGDEGHQIVALIA